jgi:hypothetical protein
MDLLLRNGVFLADVANMLPAIFETALSWDMGSPRA